MALPKVKQVYPTQRVTLPISKKEVKIRPFLVRDEKALLIIKESSDFREIADIVCDVVSSCVVGEKLDARKLPIPDVEYLFLKTQCVSKGQTRDLPYQCQNLIPEEDKDGKQVPNGGAQKCGTVVRYTIHLDKIEPKQDPLHTNSIPVPDTDFVIVLRYPTFSDLGKRAGARGDVSSEEVYEATLDLMSHVIDTKENKVYDEFTREELVKFVDDLSPDVMKDIFDRFFDRMPQVAHDIDFSCPKCGCQELIHLEGLADFF